MPIRRHTLVPTLLATAALALGALAPAAASAPPVASSAGTSTAAAPDPDCPQLQLKDRWYGDNAERIQRVIDRRGRCGWADGEAPEATPYAVFDWDNTMIKNDISDQTLFWMLRHDKLLQPRGGNWRTTSQYMTDDGARALRWACGDLAAPGEPLPTRSSAPRSVRCADEIVSVRKEETTTDGEKVFAGYHHRRMQAMYAWVGQVLQGYTPEQVRRIAAKARTAALEAPKGATQRVGSSRQTAWIRYYPTMRDLVRTLHRAGIEPWIVSASPKEFADVWGPAVGIDPDHTIGVSQLTTDGRLNGHLEGCGGVPDGADSVMTYVDGKRCFINKRIAGIDGPRGLRPAPYRLRPVITGGDATTDVSMLSDATGVRITLNRNDDEVMCRAYDDPDGRWLVQPMFIDPLPRKEGRYPCSTTGALDGDGDEVPVRRPDGTVVPDQRDTVFGRG
ncbi:haloacid dehalogenase-like hydrolase [uncultured Nocardioides sp.]|uniref:haloacid dehalogenase-like hydrolase n=1 Tax=uncultured Nocardioides sp. TaxID=198441 RepID=UPI00261CFC25|nr:haloacid dehalogenase-like hydrolase [uncultured Nocardioides sp.]